MSNLSQFLNSGISLRAIQAAGPGSNGYWRREMFLFAGAYAFVVKKTGRHRIYALGAAGGGGYQWPGAPGGYAFWEGDLVAGETVNITIGAGGIGTDHQTNGGDGGTTTIICAARGLGITITGATGGRSGGVGMAGGVASGGQVNKPGVVPLAASTGGPSSPSPWGPSYANPFGTGGSGWGGPASGIHGASSHRRSKSPLPSGGLSIRPADSTSIFRNACGESAPWWDLADIEGAGGAANTTNGISGNGGMGAGGAGVSNTGGDGGFGGGGGVGASEGGNGGNGGGAGACSGTTGTRGGNGGAGACIIYWDEV